jgi:RING-variant domain
MDKSTPEAPLEPPVEPLSSISPQSEPSPPWTYPTRMCRICHEDVVPTITMYPPGLPPAFQRPLIEYKNEDEYGRLIKPCKCRGGMRYIHEMCLKNSRTHGVRAGSLWKCHECGHQFNFQRLTLQRYLGSTSVSAAATVLVMILMMFILGFIADPIINLYVDPYDTLVGREDFWSEVELQNANEGVSGWSLHFLKGMVSMGLVGFLKTALLNPFQWWNLRGTGWISARSSGTSTTGRDRAANVSWIAIVIGISSAFYFFYQWVQTIIGRTLQRIGNNIVDTQLPGDDDDLKPPPGWKYDTPESNPKAKAAESAPVDAANAVPSADTPNTANTDGSRVQGSTEAASPPLLTECLPEVKQQSNDAPKSVPLGDVRAGSGVAYSSALDSARDQDWSFVDL